jgi:NADP-reducing hydrogenase subunit HndB
MNLEKLRQIREKAQHSRDQILSEGKMKVIVCMSTSGIAAGAREVMKRLLDEISKRELTNIIVTQTGEKGLQTSEPVVIIEEKDKPRIMYGNVTPDIMSMIVIEHLINGIPVQNHIFHSE